MDINDIRAAFSVIMFVMFIAIFMWAWSRKRKSDFNEAANLPLNEPEFPKTKNSKRQHNNGGQQA